VTTSTMALFYLALLCIAASASADITFTRTVDQVTNATATVTFDHGCTQTDKYGSNSCTFKWGEKVGVTYNVTTGELTADNKLELSVKVDKIIPLTVSCPVCGDTCEIKIPGKPIKIPLPPCPIKAQSLHNTTFFTFPAKDPLPNTIITGTITLSDASGATMDKVDINADASPSA